MSITMGMVVSVCRKNQLQIKGILLDMTSKQQELFGMINLISDCFVRDFVDSCLRNVPRYFWKIPASCSGNYHPQESLCVGGLVHHTILAVNYAVKLCGEKGIVLVAKDQILAAVLLHDTCTAAPTDAPDYSCFENNPLLPGKYFREIAMMAAGADTEEIFTLVESHMGQWSSEGYHPKTIQQKIVHYADYLASRKEQPIIDVKAVLQPLDSWSENDDVFVGDLKEMTVE